MRWYISSLTIALYSGMAGPKSGGLQSLRELGWLYARSITELVTHRTTAQ